MSDTKALRELIAEEAVKVVGGPAWCCKSCGRITYNAPVHLKHADDCHYGRTLAELDALLSDLATAQRERDEARAELAEGKKTVADYIEAAEAYDNCEADTVSQRDEIWAAMWDAWCKMGDFIKGVAA